MPKKGAKLGLTSYGQCNPIKGALQVGSVREMWLYVLEASKPIKDGLQVGSLPYVLEASKPIKDRLQVGRVCNVALRPRDQQAY